ncbi:hypothetical protein I4U23_026765 [Adineta vaga]|nr:hypothetical protein I4U23_026765 [Adineta vaga]
MDDGYQSLTDDDQKLFEQFLRGIEQKVRETFPTIPYNFPLKPVAIRKQMGCGIFYNLKVALPNNQFANVSFHMGGLRAPLKPGEKEPEQQFYVDPTPSDSKTSD